MGADEVVIVFFKNCKMTHSHGGESIASEKANEGAKDMEFLENQK